MRYVFDVEIEASDDDYVKSVRAAVTQLLKDWAVPSKVGTIRELEAVTADMIVVFTDGGCDSKRDGLGAWAHMIVDMQNPDVAGIQTGVFLGTTNNRMEMLAVIKALEEVEIGRPIRVVLDSEYVAKGCTEWLRNWKRRGWKTFSGTPVMNRDLWERLDSLCSIHNIQFQTVKGHSGHKENEAEIGRAHV